MHESLKRSDYFHSVSYADELQCQPALDLALPWAISIGRKPHDYTLPPPQSCIGRANRDGEQCQSKIPGKTGDRRDVILIFLLLGARPGGLPGDFGERKCFLPGVGDRFSRTASFLWSQAPLGVVFERVDELR